MNHLTFLSGDNSDFEIFNEGESTTEQNSLQDLSESFCSFDESVDLILSTQNLQSLEHHLVHHCMREQILPYLKAICWLSNMLLDKALLRKYLKNCYSLFQYTFLLQHKLQGVAINYNVFSVECFLVQVLPSIITAHFVNQS